MTEQMKCKIVSFEDVYSMVRNVSEKIKDSGFEPTTIVGLARGGWVPARLLCDFLGITDLVSLKVEHWLETGKTSNEAIIKYPVTTSLAGKRILIFDDITDTGESLITASEHLGNLHPEESRVGVMQYITSSKRIPDYYAEKVTDWYWFIYPWNWIEDTSTLIVRLMSEDQTETWNPESINASLHEYFGITWDQAMLEYILNIMNERGQIDRPDEDRKFTLKTRTVIRL
ncbi:MAG: phosphoribosyltransferase [Candidatus Bathyarchaeota archaeon]|jgi:hypoxanthine phosphoribosyltransferase|nr:phosphoribosyltransferase [Candidatus Bathyarchaeota archaeon]